MGENTLSILNIELISLLLHFKSIIEKILCQMNVLEIFSFSLLFLFVLLFFKQSFKEQTFLILIKSILSVYSFIVHAFGVTLKKSLPNPRSQMFPPVFSSRSFTVLDFRTIIHFELLYSARYKSKSKRFLKFKNIYKSIKDLYPKYIKNIQNSIIENIQPSEISKNNEQMLLQRWYTDKHMKRCSVSLVIRKMQIKTAAMYHYLP